MAKFGSNWFNGFREEDFLLKFTDGRLMPSDDNSSHSLLASWANNYCTHCVILNRYITVGRGICEKYQSRDGQIMSQDWNFLQIPHTTVIHLYICLITPNIHLYLDVCVYKERSFMDMKHHHFHLEAYFFLWECNRNGWRHQNWVRRNTRG